MPRDKKSKSRNHNRRNDMHEGHRTGSQNRKSSNDWSERK